MEKLSPAARIGHVALTVADIDRQIGFYQRAIGLKLHHRDGNIAYLGVGVDDLLILHGNQSAPRAGHTTGLFHFAILVPSRADLAAMLAHLVEQQVMLEGSADHLVSEALYLADPEGNGIEIYRDRPREQWRFRDGQLQMTTDPLDLHALLAEAADPATWAGLPNKTVIGHMHLRVRDIAESEAFYRELIGFDLMTRYGASASFLAAGGYHHHLGINTWQSRGAAAASADARGLRYYQIRLPDETTLAAVEERLVQANVPTRKSADGTIVRDPSGIAVMLTAGAGL